MINSIHVNGDSANNKLPHIGGHTPKSQSLTEVEVITRNTLKFPLADGHMAWYDAPWMDDLYDLLKMVESESQTITDRESEARYIHRFASTFGQSIDLSLNTKVLPNASLSIDVLMAVAKRRKWSVQLIDPAFDNLYLYAKERELPLSPLLEENLKKYGADAIDDECDLIVLISPNNPTGFTLSETEFRDIASKVAMNRKTLALDTSFRAYDQSGCDHYQILKEEGTSYVLIEDTGKTLPTRERKVSLLTCSNDLRHDINEVAEIHVLGWSTPIMLLCEKLLARIDQIGLKDALLDEIGKRKENVHSKLTGTFLRPAPSANGSCLPVEWLEITDNRFSDESFASYLREYHDLGILPGNHFFWSSQKPVDQFVRLTLMKDTTIFESGVERLRKAILSSRF